MKEKYITLITFLIFTCFTHAQDCSTQRTLSNDTTICQGQNTNITLLSSELAVVYQLRNGVVNVGAPVIGTGGAINFNVTPATTTTYSVYVVICDITYNDTCTITVDPIPNASATNSSQTICSNTAINTMILSGSVTATAFNWTRNNTTNVTGITASGSGNISGTLINGTNSPQTVTFTITPVANGCSGTPINTTVLVNPTPNASATNSSQTICSNTTINTIALSGSVTATAFNWTRNNTTNVTGITASGSGNISGTLINGTNTPQTVTFTITPIANGCSGTPINTTRF